MPSIEISLNLVFPLALNFSSKKFSITSPLKSPLFFKILMSGPIIGILPRGVLSINFLKSILNKISFNSLPLYPTARSEATIAPAEVPAIFLNSYPCSLR